MRCAYPFVLYGAFAACFGCGDGGGSNNDSRDPDPTSTPTPAVIWTPTPQLTPAAGANAWSVGQRDAPGSRSGFILRSTDAGAHWTETLSVENVLFEGVSFADPARGWVVGTGELLRSDDGGLTWSSQRAAVPVDVFSLSAVQALDRDTAVSVGGGLPLQGTGDAASLILRTADGGSTWRVSSIAAGRGGDPTRTRLASVCITTGGTGFAVGSGVSTRLVARTADNGLSWTDVTAAVLEGSAASELFDVACLDEEYWIVSSDAAHVRYSGNAGSTWSDLAVPSDVARLAGISAPARGVAVAVGFDSANEPLIIRTADSGSTWTRQPVAGVTEEGLLNDVDFAGPDSGTAVGQLGAPGIPNGSLTAISEDRGVTWAGAASLPGSVQVRDVARVEE